MVMRFFLIVFISTFSLWPTASQAWEDVTFSPPISFRENEVVKAYKKLANKKNPMLIAPADFNDDFINEYILKPESCAKGTICTHVLMAYMEEKPIQIGEIDAHKIMLSFKKDYGVKRLIVYNQEHNDFASVQSRWNPHIFRYEAPKN